MKNNDELIKAVFTALLGFLCLSGATLLNAQQLPGSFKASWVGNTFGKGGPATSLNHAWVQNYIDCMVVMEDGTCHTTSIWDEGGRRYGVYKDGRVLGNNNRNISCGQAGGFSISGTQIRGNGKTITDAGKPMAIAMGRGDYSGKLLVADDGPRKQILIYDVTADPVIIETVGVEGGVGASFISGYDFPAAIHATAYPAGHYPPGVYHPLKFWTLTGVGMDAQGRLFVSSSELGASIRCFKKEDGNWILDWKLENFIFVDNGDFDRTNEGIDIYTVQERFRMDYSKEAQGAEWRIQSITVDAVKYPNDPRGIWWLKAGHEHGLTSSLIRYIDGKRFLFVNGMTCQWTWVFRFIEGTDIAVPSVCFTDRHRIYDIKPDIHWPPNVPSTGGNFIWRDVNGDVDFQASEFQTTRYGHTHAWHVDEDGGLWGARGSLVHRYAPNGLDDVGNPIYDDSTVTTYSLLGVGNISRVFFDKERDRLYVLNGGCRHLKDGSLSVVDNLSKGNRTVKLVARLKGNNPSAIDLAGDYLFEVGWETRGKCWVTDLRTGETVGTMEPYGDAGTTNYTGWVDIGYGITAYKRTNGEYIILVEDDGWGKILMYRWCPTGDCAENCTSQVDRIEVNPQSLIMEGFQLDTLSAVLYPDTVCDRKVFWSSSDVSVASVDIQGVVTSAGTGTAWIRAVSSQQKEFADSCLVTVKEVPISGISFANDSIWLPVGKTFTPEVFFYPANTLNRKLNWESSADTIAMVDQNGLVKALRTGNTWIIAMSETGGFSDSCYVEVTPVLVEGITMNVKTMNLWIGEAAQAEVTLKPANAFNKRVSWHVHDESVAAVDTNGLVTARGIGRTRLLVTTLDGGFRDSCDIRVLAYDQFANSDVGNVCVGGSFSVGEDGSYTLTGGGADIWFSADGFHYAYTKTSDDIVIMARVKSMGNTHPWAKAGVMFRESLEPGAKHAMMVLTPGNGTSMQWRTITDAGSGDNTPKDGLKAPCWVKIIRRGNVYTGYSSVNGIHWTKIHEVVIDMGHHVHVGLCVTSHEDCTLNTTVFDHVIVSDDLDLLPFDVTNVPNNDPVAIMLFPNPANDYVKLMLPHASAGSVQVRIYDLTGRLCLSKQLAVTEGGHTAGIQVSTLHEGVYLLDIGNDIKTQMKLIIKR